MKNLITAVVLILATGPALAQQPRMSPEQMQAMMQAQMQMMVPMFAQMTRAAMDAQFDVLSQPATAQKLATYSRNLYEALLAKGFNGEDAMRLTVSIGIPATPMMGR